MAIELQSGLSGRDHYAATYDTALEAQANWLERGASTKADSVELLLRKLRVRPRTLTELGAGTGAVLSECRRRGLAAKYRAVDYSHSAVAYMRETRGLDAVKADITSPDFRLEHSDVVVLSHVVEHLENPRAFLTAMRSRLSFDLAVIEVPLEDLPLCRLKALLRDRAKNTAGHVQFYTQRSFERLVTSCGLRIVGRRTYAPIPTLDDMRLVMRNDRLPAWRLPLMWLMRRALPMALGPLWTRLNYAHHAVICRPA